MTAALKKAELWILLGPLFIVVAISAYFAKQPMSEDVLWTLGFIFSVGLSFFITVLAFRELSAGSTHLEGQLTHIERIHKDTLLLKAREQRKLELELDELTAHINRLQEAEQTLDLQQVQLEELNTLRSNHHELGNINKTLHTQLETHQAQVNALQARERGYEAQLEELNTLRTNYYELENINKTLHAQLETQPAENPLQAQVHALQAREREFETQLQSMHTQRIRMRQLDSQIQQASTYSKRIVELEEQASAEKQHITDLEQALATARSEPPVEEGAALRELRKQFKEKSEVLHDARKELFEAQETLQTIQRERSEEKLMRSNDVASLEESLAKVFAEQQDFESQVSSLEEIVSSFSKT